MATPTEFPIDGPLIGEVFRLGLGQDEPGTLPRHRHDLSREQVETTQKARIILATAEIVTEQGYAKASSRAIIDRAGVSSKTFYAHFRGKEDAFLAGYTLLDGVMLQASQQPITIEQPRTDLRAAVQAALERLAAWPLFARMRLIEGRAAGPVADERRLAMWSAQTDVFERAIVEARKHDDRIGLPTRAALSVLVMGLSDLMAGHIATRDAESLPELAPAMVEAIERFLVGDPPPYAHGE